MLLRVGVISLCLSLALALMVTVVISYDYGPRTQAAVAEEPIATEHSAAKEPATPTSMPKPAFLPDLRDEEPTPRPEKTPPQRRTSAAGDAKESTGEAGPPSDPGTLKEARPKAKSQKKVSQNSAPRSGQRRHKQQAQSTKVPKAGEAGPSSGRLTLGKKRPTRPVKATKPGEREAAARSVAKTKARERAARGKAGRTGPALGTAMNLTIESIGLRDAPVESTGRQRALDNGLIRTPQSSLPWDRGPARNVYVVGHRLGWPGTGSWKVFYELDELRRGDEVMLTDRRGKIYRYRVSERLVVSPSDVWVMDRVRGRDMVTLQTCTGPYFSQRLIVRADRV